MRKYSFLPLLLLAPLPASADPLQDLLPPRWQAETLPETDAELEHPAYFEQLDIARSEVHHGRYRRALITLAPLDATPEVQTLRGEALGRLGKMDEAQRLLQATNTPESARILGELLLSDYRPADAIAVLTPFENEVRTRVLLGRAYEDVGDLEQALRVYEWFAEEPQSFVRRWTTGDTLGEAADLTAIGTALDRWATITMQYRESPDLNDVILSMFVTAYDVVDRDYWPARVAAAQFLLQRGDAEAALEELSAAYAANPNHEATLNLLALATAAQFEFAKSDRAVAELRETNPDSLAASVAEVMNLLRQRRIDAAETVVARLLEQRPEHLDMLGLQAAIDALQLRDDAAAEVLKRVETIDPDNATAFAVVGKQLSDLRQYERAEAMLRTAVERAPWWSVPRNELAHLLVQSGKEDEARGVLAAAFAIDPYNRQTLNYQRVLEDMQAFESFETEHFKISYHPDFDKAIAEESAKFLEEIYPEVTGRFDFEPPFKTHVQWFPTNDAFAVRVTGDPFVGALGACTGPVVAMRSPGDPKVNNYDWQETLRHEFAHTVTLTKTENRIAHWMTEGLSVTEEYGPIPFQWVPLLNMAVTKDELFPLNRLTWGFVRPRRPFDRQLAYAQAGWLCGFIAETYGDVKINALLLGFRDGRAQGPLFEDVLGEDEDAVFAKFKQWAQQQTDTWGYDDATTAAYEKLLPEAEALVKSRQWAEAVTAWEQLQQMRPNDPLPYQRLAGLYVRAEQPAKAVEMLQALTEREEQDNRYAKLAARLLRQSGHEAEALVALEQATRLDFYDDAAHDLKAEVQEALGDAEAAARSREIAEYLRGTKQVRAEGRTR